MSESGETAPIKLPEPKLKGEMSVEEAIANRRSRRNWRGDAGVPAYRERRLEKGKGLET